MRVLKLLGIVSCVALSMLSFSNSCEAAGETIEVTRDSEKTIYFIGSEEKKSVKTGEDKDRERSWEMLKNMNIIIDTDKNKDQEK